MGRLGDQHPEVIVGTAFDIEEKGMVRKRKRKHGSGPLSLAQDQG
jgi:hypothetical protein